MCTGGKTLDSDRSSFIRGWVLRGGHTVLSLTSAWLQVGAGHVLGSSGASPDLEGSVTLTHRPLFHPQD